MGSLSGVSVWGSQSSWSLSEGLCQGGLDPPLYGDDWNAFLLLNVFCSSLSKRLQPSLPTLYS